jgi:hypothetical protein
MILTPLALAALGLSSPQFENDPVALTPHPVEQALESWEEKSGGSWRMRLQPETGAARFLYGQALPMGYLPASDEAWFELGREALNDAFDLFLIHDSTLVDSEVKFLDLSRIGTSDKFSVEFAQAKDGIPVFRGTANALFDAQGRLLSLDSNALPGVENLNTAPIADPYVSGQSAMRAFIGEHGQRPEALLFPKLTIIGHLANKMRTPRLTWAVELRAGSNTVQPVGEILYVAADDTSGEILHRRSLIHNQNLSGHAEAWASPGTLPDMSSNPEVLFPMGFMDVTSSAGNTTADINGDFSIPYSGSSNVDLTFQFRGPLARVLDSSGAEHSLTQSFQPGVNANATLNANKTAADTAEANAYRGMIDFNNWIKYIDPSDTKMDFQVTANVNLSSTCNAYYNGSSINFYANGGGCNNTSYSTVVAHEEGHWANDRYGSYNGSDGFGEGNADVYGNFIYDNPITGEYFFTSGGYVRTALNNRQYCGDGNGGCYGQVHADGEVLMGALWKVRARMNTTYGNAAGDLLADTLHSAWMNAYNDGSIHSIIEEHWLALDDNDGNIFNGTPNYTDIDLGFRDQGFPGVDLQLIDIAHTVLPDTQNEAGPYVVNAQISSWIGASISGAEVVYSVNDGPESTLSMTNTSGSDWTTSIPGQISPAKVSYRIEAHDSAGNNVNDPFVGDHSFIIGVVTQLHFNDFEGTGDEGWSHGQVATQDDWQRGAPQGTSGTNSWGVAWEDPGSAFSGTKCWANDLGNSGFNGSYAPDVDNWLESPAIDCSGAFGVKLRFQQWLSVEQGVYDHAKILVNGNVAWQNPQGSHTQDTSWTGQEIDISQWADNNSNVKIRFTLDSDGGLELGGWAIDDFELLTIDGVPGGSNTITLQGPTAATVGSTVTYTISNAPASSPFWLAWSTSNNGQVFQGHSFDLSAPMFVAFTGTTDAAGMASMTSPPLSASSAGRSVWLEVACRSAGQWTDSNAVNLTIQ